MILTYYNRKWTLCDVASTTVLLMILFLNLFLTTGAQTQKIKYQIEPDGYSFSIQPNWNNEIKMHRMSHRSDVDSVVYDEYYNRAIRRGNSILVSGDKPAFALMQYLKQDKLDPDLVKMGSGRIQVTIGDKSGWLELQKDIKVIFRPWSTEYDCTLPFANDLKIKLVVSQARDWGMVVKLSFQNISSQQIAIGTNLLFGGLRVCGRTFSASYFSETKEDENDRCVIDEKNQVAELSSSGLPGKTIITAIPYSEPVVLQSRVSFTHELNLKKEETGTIYFAIGQTVEESDEENLLKKITTADPEVLMLESKNYYNKILEKYSISTPDKLLNAGFKTALLNFDNIRSDSAWLEGVHWWASYTSNNYQISAATSMGDIQAASRALYLFNTPQYGPAPSLGASGRPFIDSIFWWGSEDGLPYYIYQLNQYYHATGDSELVRRIWPGLKKSIRRLFDLRDPDGNGLINWHAGSNSFLYQADHLGMPGDAASPSLIMAYNLIDLSTLAQILGDADASREWKSLSDKIFLNLENLLWNSKIGFFHSHKDLQGIKPNSHYYTDLVFPALYSNLPDIYGWQSLHYLYNTLWCENYEGQKKLMRTGNLKPSIFGNDNVMPVQMAEAARAYFKYGDAEKGISLMQSVALASTVFTEAPGSFPERLSDEGKGEANYLFGNPIGAFIYTTIDGIFGLGLKKGGAQLRWNPSFPDDWDSAALNLPYAKTEFIKYSKGNERSAKYKVTYDRKRELHFTLLIEPSSNVEIRCNNKRVNYRVFPGFGKIKIELEDRKAFSHTIIIRYIPLRIKKHLPPVVYSNGSAQWSFDKPVEKISDPQHLFKKMKIAGTSLQATVNDNSGTQQFFVKLKDIDAIFPVVVQVKPAVQIQFPFLRFDVQNRKLRLRINSFIHPAKDERYILRIQLLDKKKDISISNKNEYAEWEIEFVQSLILPGTMCTVQYSLLNGSEMIHSGSQDVLIIGTDPAASKLMEEYVESHKKHLQLDAWFNTNRICAVTEWRSNNYTVIDSNYFSSVSDGTKSVLKNFGVSFSEPKLAMVNLGISERNTREMVRSNFPANLSIPVNKKCYQLSLLFINEMEARLTQAEVGALTLLYSDGSKRIIPLITGRNVDAFSKFFAPELIPVQLRFTDYAKIYNITANPFKELKSFTINITAADVQIGVMGVTIIESK